MNKKLIALVIVPIVALVFVLSDDFDTQISGNTENTSTYVPDEPTSIGSPTLQSTNQQCSGSAKCIVGTVTEVIDGNTIRVDDKSIRFALSSAPGLNAYGGIESKSFIQTICPVGSEVLVDEDDGQPPEGHSRIIGVVHCNDVILNKELLDADMGYLSSRFCDSSEFASDSWAQKHGC